MTELLVNTATPYAVQIARGCLSEVGARVRALLPKARCAAILSDSNVAPLYLDGVAASLSQAGLETISFCIPAGEASKTGEQYLALLSCLAEQPLTRSDVLVALGGGVVGDLGGFAAATYLRGLPFVQLPTTLLAAVDSSVGGKTAIDLPAGKNLAGAFYQPRLVLCDPETFATLPDVVFSDGCAEVVKYGMLGSAPLLTQLKEGAMASDLEGVIAACVGMKRDIVERDEFDLGERQLLNLGHTLGHAIEGLSHYAVSHGSAVAMGMACITRAAVRRGLCPPDCLDVLLDLLARFSLPHGTDYSAAALYQAALGDKKRTGDTLALIVPTALGRSERMEIPVQDLLSWIEAGVNP